MTTLRPWNIVNCVAKGDRGYIRIEGPNGEKVADIFPFARENGTGYETALANAEMIVKLINAQTGGET